MSIAETISKAFQNVKTVCTVQEAEKSPRTDGLSARRMDLRCGVNFLNLREAYGSGELTYSTGDLNISRIVDKLIRLTAKYTSDYASDIYYTLQELYKAVEETGEPMCQIISFRERACSPNRQGSTQRVLCSSMFLPCSSVTTSSTRHISTGCLRSRHLRIGTASASF